MTKKDFFRIIIKLFGLHAATFALFSLLPRYAGYMVNEFDATAVFIVITIFIVIILLLVALIFGADIIINYLKLDKGFDDDYIKFGDLTELNVLKLSVIIISGLLIIDNFPTFLNHCYFILKDLFSNQGADGMLDAFTNDRVNYFQFSVTVISIILGYLMITNYTYVAKWLLNAGKKTLDSE